MLHRWSVPALVAGVLALAASTGLTGCVPTPKAGTIDVVGDSLAFQANWARPAEFLVGSPRGADVALDFRPGIGFPDVMAAQRTRVAAARPAILVVALGTNDAGPLDNGWNAADDKELRALMALPSPTTCVVLVLPGAADKPAVTATYRTDLTAARAAMRKAAADRKAKGQPTVVADWGAVALARPELTVADGIHLADDAPSAPGRIVNEAAANAWTKVLWSGVAACPKR
ncbi:MAG TPA: SGNH/GDSL hydrolase family protein [Acidimicrobiales bacterium]|nr:SGNH/GDSL hydrolase family protein [Acidimicrobiales bacterium]